MSKRRPIQTSRAAQAIGPYSQAISTADTVYVSGQIPLDPESMQLAGDDIESQTHQVFANLQAIAEAAGTSLDRALKLTIYLTDLSQFATVNEIMAAKLSEPFPTRATIEVSALPKGALVEIDAILAL